MGINTEKRIWRDLYCKKCETVQGFTRADVTGWKHYYCNRCELFTVHEFIGETYGRSRNGERIEQVLPLEGLENE